MVSTKESSIPQGSMLAAHYFQHTHIIVYFTEYCVFEFLPVEKYLVANTH